MNLAFHYIFNIENTLNHIGDAITEDMRDLVGSSGFSITRVICYDNPGYRLSIACWSNNPGTADGSNLTWNDIVLLFLQSYG